MNPQPTRNQPVIGRPQLTFPEQKRLLSSRSKEYTLQNKFNYGYRNKEDVSNLPPNTLVIGSQNVLTNAAELVGIRNGYVLDGAAGNQNTYGIDSGYDFLTRLGTRENLRKWGPNLEVRYVNPVSSAVSWVNILSTLNPSNVVNFTNFWDQNTELKMFCLFVNGGQNLYEWSSGMASFLSDSSAPTGIITSVTIGAAGSQYSVGEILTLAGGTGGTVQVTATGATGTVTAVSILTAGSGYSTATETTTSNRSGVGATITVATIASGPSITVSGSYTLSQLGFYDNASDSSRFSFTINGTTYTYTGVSGQTFYGVSPNPTLSSISVGDPIIQLPVSIPGTSITTNGSGNLGAFTFDLISVLENQVWYGQKTSTNVYVSQTNNYKNVTYTTPSRLPSEGALIVLDAPPVGFSPQSSQMYITAGTDQWWISQKNQQTIDISGVATPTETLYAVRLKTALNQAAQSQNLITRYKNSLIYVSNEQIINALGLVQNIQADPQVTNMSDPIKYDIDAYDFTGGQALYDNYFIYVSVPVDGVIRMYNVVKQYWEAPQTIPVGVFYHPTAVTGSIIYGHSSLTNESYELFTGSSDNSNPINAVAAFPYVCQLGGSPTEKKSFNKIYTEGYISLNATLMLTINYDFGGTSGTYTTIIPGQPSDIIFNKVTDGSLGQNTLGSQPLGTVLNIPNAPANPKFRVINTMPRVDMFEYQIVYSSDDTDFVWSILRFGPAVSSSSALPVSITL